MNRNARLADGPLWPADSDWRPTFSLCVSAARQVACLAARLVLAAAMQQGANVAPLAAAGALPAALEAFLHLPLAVHADRLACDLCDAVCSAHKREFMLHSASAASAAGAGPAGSGPSAEGGAAAGAASRAAAEVAAGLSAAYVAHPGLVARLAKLATADPDAALGRDGPGGGGERGAARRSALLLHHLLQCAGPEVRRAAAAACPAPAQRLAHTAAESCDEASLNKLFASTERLTSALRDGSLSPAAMAHAVAKFEARVLAEGSSDEEDD